MSRRYPTAEAYEDRERDFYRPPRRSAREYEEVEFDLARGRGRDPDFLRDDYGHSANGPLIIRDRERVDEFDRPLTRRPRDVEREEIVIRDDKRGGRRERSVSRETRRGSDRLGPTEMHGGRGPRAEKEETEVRIRKEEIDRPGTSRDVEREEILVRKSETDLRHPRRRDLDRDSDFSDRTSDAGFRRPPRSHRGDVEREEIVVRKSETDLPYPRSHASHSHSRTREEIIVRNEEIGGPRGPPGPPLGHRHLDRDEFVVRRGHGPRRPPPIGPPAGVEREEVIIRHDHPSQSRGRRSSSSSSSRSRLTSIRARSRSAHRARRRPDLRPDPRDLVARETEEFVIRRTKPRGRSSSSSSSSSCSHSHRGVERQEIIIRKTERSPSPVSTIPPPPIEPIPDPEPILQPIIRPPIHQQIHQEIITHHRHIDHGVERARSLSPPMPPPLPRSPTPPPEPKVEELEIDIHRHEDGKHSDQNILIRTRGSHSRSRSRSSSRSRHRMPPPREMVPRRGRSLSTPRRRYDDDLDAEGDYYNQRAQRRGHIGEAYNGATRDWELVDVPPGTERVRMDGVGGSSQEITWQRYNGARRSKFITDDREVDSGFGVPARRSMSGLIAEPQHRRPSDMWTEITKDLVLRDSIEHMGYPYEETDEFFYVMEYLRYEDVLQLVEISDEIHHRRRRRIREIEFEREEMKSHRRNRRGRRHRHGNDGFYESELIVDSRRYG